MKVDEMAGQSDTSPITRLKRLITNEREDITLLLLLTVGYGLLTIAMPLAVQTLVNNVVMGGVVQPLVVVSVILLILLLLSSIFFLTEVYLVEIIQRRIFVRCTARIANNINGVCLSVYDSLNPVELMNRYFDVMTMQKSTATILTVSLTALLQGIIGSLILLFYSIYFAGAVLVIMVVITWIIFILGKSAQETAIKESTKKYKMAAWLESLAKNTVLNKFYSAKKRTRTNTDAIATEYLRSRETHFSVLFKQQIGVFILYTLMGTGILVMSGLLVINGTIDIGQFVAAELIIFGVLGSFVRFVTKLETFYDLLAALDKLGVIFDLPQEGNKTQHNFEKIKHLKVDGLITHETKGRDSLSSIQFELTAGESIAVIGESGCGKSLLASVMTGLRTFSQGVIKYNAVDIRQLHLEKLRRDIALLDQVELVEGSILDNLRLSNKDLKLDEINYCLESLGLLEDIHNLKEGIDTPLNAAGRPLSDTQLQFLMLARAILAKPTLIIIDGMLDNLNQEQLTVVVNVLKARQAENLLVVMTRRPTVAKQFDRQVALEKGQF